MVSPVLDTITPYLTRLRTDLARIEASSATEDVKAEACALTAELVSRLEECPGALAVMEADLVPKVVRLNAILASHAAEPLGACIIGSDCIQTTQSHCTELGGKWAQGVPCPSVKKS
jgi:hypothetical protein